MATSWTRSWVPRSKGIFLTLSSVTISTAFVLWYCSVKNYDTLKTGRNFKKHILKSKCFRINLFGVHCVLKIFCRSLWYFNFFSLNWKCLLLKLTVLESRTKSEPVEKLITEKKNLCVIAVVCMVCRDEVRFLCLYWLLYIENGINRQFVIIM